MFIILISTAAAGAGLYFLLKTPPEKKVLPQKTISEQPAYIHLTWSAEESN